MNLKFKTLTTNVDYSAALEAEVHSKNGGRMKKQKSSCNIIYFVCLLIFSISCSSAKIYTNPDAISYTTKHKTLAILPPTIKIEIKNSKKVSLENNQEQERIESIKTQNVTYSYLLEKVQKGKICLDIQDVEKTNVMLSKINYYSRADANMTPKEIAKALAVDAVLFSSYICSKTGIIIPTYSVDANLRLFDEKTGYIFWNYGDSKSVTTSGITYEPLINLLIEKAIKKTPYYKK